jgi:hypothetical protein
MNYKKISHCSFLIDIELSEVNKASFGFKVMNIFGVCDTPHMYITF